VCLVVELIALGTGVKKMDPKEALGMVLESIRAAKINNPGKDTSLLDGVENGIVFLVSIWDKINTMFKKPPTTATPAPVK
jgi:hypothetical protein